VGSVLTKPSLTVTTTPFCLHTPTPPHASIIGLREDAGMPESSLNLIRKAKLVRIFFIIAHAFEYGFNVRVPNV